jgi:hypothetical protein
MSTTSNLLPGEVYCECLFERLATEDPDRLLRMVTSGELRPGFMTYAAEQLGKCALVAETIIQALLPLLAHESPLVREGAVLGLAHRWTDAVYEAVNRVSYQDQSPGMRELAQSVLDEWDEIAREALEES